jgi:hypothetical protein
MTETKSLSDVQRRALLHSEAQKEMRARGCTYEQAFSTVLTIHPEWQGASPPRLATERPQRTSGQLISAGVETTDTERGQRIQELVNAYLSANPKTSYDVAFKRVLEDPKNKELVEGMHRPGRGAVNLWQKRSTDGATPPSKYPQGQGTNLPASTPAERAARLSR